MTDDDVLAAVRECLTTARDNAAGEQLARPAGDIFARVRRRRLRQGLATAATVVVIAAAAVAAMLPGAGASPARLAAWTVAHESGGQLAVTIRELRDPAGLQRKLRADGIAATVRFGSPIPRPGQIPRGCLYYPLSSKHASRLLGRVFPLVSSTSARTAFTINPAAIPARIGLWITVSPPRTRAAQGHPRSLTFSAFYSFVYASGRCPSGKSPHGISVGGVIGHGFAAGGGVAGGGTGKH